ncbi:MAG: ATP-binding protein [Synergistaceae bacterium]|nr:ATP-binding protein [Synergistaceae bacterium]
MKRAVLAVDGSPIVRAALAGILKCEYDVFEARAGKEALNIINDRAKSISAVVMDIDLPDMDGYSTLRKIKTGSPLSQIPVVVMTSPDDEEAHEKAVACGADSFITKPINSRPLLLHAVQNAVGMSEAALPDNAAEKKSTTQKIIDAEQIQSILQGVNGGVAALTLDGDKLNYIFFNERYHDMFGYTREQFLRELPRGFRDLIPPEYEESVLATVREQNATGKSKYIEFPVRHRDGHIVWVNTSSSVTRMPGYDAPVHLSVLIDITAQHEAAGHAARHALLQKTYDMTLENMPGFTAKWMFKDGDVLLLGANQKYLDFMRATAKEVFGKSIIYGFTVEEKASIISLLYEKERQKEPISFSSRACRMDGSECWLKIQASFFEERDGCSVYFGTLTDITELMEAQESLKKSHEELCDAIVLADSANKAKSIFTSRISHEIRTPLNAIIGYHAIVEAEPDENIDKIRDCIKKANIASQHLLLIINEVLEMSAIESGKVIIASEPFDFRQLITSVSVFFHNQASAKGIRFEVDLKSITDEFFIGDQTRLRQILVNLLANAVKFTEVGEVRLTISQIDISDKLTNIKFEITDTGIGMAPEYLKHIWEPYEQESAETGRRFGGTGLGLSIAKNLCDLMHGNIEVKSVKDKGTTFTVNLPMNRYSKEKDGSGASYDFSHLRALVVDDEPSACEYMRLLMNRCGIVCDTATSGVKALELLKKTRAEGKR